MNTEGGGEMEQTERWSGRVKEREEQMKRGNTC